MTKNKKLVKVDVETHKLLKTLSREITAAQNHRVDMGEIIKRNFNRFDTRDILLEDGRAKRRLSR